MKRFSAEVKKRTDNGERAATLKTGIDEAQADLRKLAEFREAINKKLRSDGVASSRAKRLLFLTSYWLPYAKSLVVRRSNENKSYHEIHVGVLGKVIVVHHLPELAPSVIFIIMRRMLTILAPEMRRIENA